MNPKLTNKQKEISLLKDCIERLENLKVSKNDLEEVANITFNLGRVRDLINGIYD